MPINGMTRAANALHYYERRQEVVANNLANADTNGFKAERVFARLLEGEVTVAGTETDLSAGALKQTNSPLDLALAGDGFFVVGTPDGERLTRGGSFRLDDTGQVVDPNGNPLLSENGPMVLPQGTITVAGDGTLSVDGKEVARLRIETVPPGTPLQHAGGTMFLPDPAQAPVAAEDRVVRQGFLEDSNVSTVGTMVDMISIQRAYAAVQRAVVTLDEVRSTISNDLGRPV